MAVRTPKGLAEGAVLRAVERYATEHAGEWFQAKELWPGWSQTDVKCRNTVNALHGHGYFDERQITCLMADGGLWMSVNPRQSLEDHLKATEVRS
jgi:hypothetical protein